MLHLGVSLHPPGDAALGLLARRVDETSLQEGAEDQRDENDPQRGCRQTRRA